MGLGTEAIFDNRELAILFWVAVVVVWALAHRDARRSLASLARTASTPKLAVPLLLLSGYVGVAVVALWSIDAWTWDLFSETVFWFAGTALVLFVSHDQMSRDPRFFRHTVVRVLSITVFIQFVVNLYTLSFVAEVVLVLGLFALGAMLALSQIRPEHHQLQGCLETAVALAAIALFVYSVGRAIQNPDSFLTVTNLRELVVPVLLTLCLFPFVYALTVWASYDSIFLRLRLRLGDDHSLHRHLCRRLLLAIGPRLRTVVYASRAPWWMLLSQPSSRSEIGRATRHIRQRNPHCLAISAVTSEQLEKIAEDQEPGWEYALLAARLDAGVTACAHGRGMIDYSGRAFELPRTPKRVSKLLQRDNADATTLLNQLEPVFDDERVEEALGPSGIAGNPAAIIDLAEDLILVYARMIEWSERAQATKAPDGYEELVRLHASMLDLPIRQIEGYVEKWTDVAENIPRLLAEAENESEPKVLHMSLVLTIDEDLLKRFSAEAQRLRGVA